MKKHLAHELIANKQADNPGLIRDMIASIKFDLGELGDVLSMAHMSTLTCIALPAPICMFQVTHDEDVHMFMAWENDEEILMHRFGKIVDNGRRWAMSFAQLNYNKDRKAVRVTDSKTGRHLIPKQIIEIYDKETPMSVGEFEWTAVHLYAVLSAIEVFSCSNVTTEEHSPSAESQRTARAMGKGPYFSWRTIVIKNNGGRSDGASTGVHASPRLHFRRGHIRKLQDKLIWVRHCMVGDKSKGFAGHDYEVAP